VYALGTRDEYGVVRFSSVSRDSGGAAGGLSWVEVELFETEVYEVNKGFRELCRSLVSRITADVVAT
jgi:hypothetical protein